MSSVYKAFLHKMGGVTQAEYVGKEGEIFWDPTVGTLKLADGSTAGGTTLNGITNGLQGRNETATVTTASIAQDATDNINITAHKGYVLYSITANKACRVRIYDSDQSRLDDASRNQGEAPTANSGLIAEAVFNASGTISFAPGVFGFNKESTPTTTVPVAVTNNTTGTTTVEVSLTVLKIEQG